MSLSSFFITILISSHHFYPVASSTSPISCSSTPPSIRREFGEEDDGHSSPDPEIENWFEGEDRENTTLSELLPPMVLVRYSHQRRKFCFCKLFAMGTNESFDHSLSTYSQLLDSASQDMEHSFMYSAFHSSSPKPPIMLCFGNVNNNNTSISIDNNKKLEEELGFVERGNKVIQKSGITGGSTDSSSASSSNNNNCSNSFTKSKVGKEKIGERITALQQLVSPFGKVLSSPYLQKLPTSGPFAEGGRRAAAGTGGADLRSRGLCLVPIDYTLHVTSCNGADLWSPAAAMGNFNNLTKNAN